MPIHRKETPACPIELAIVTIAARWKAMIIYQLLVHQSRSYGELRATLAGISDRVLTTQLKELGADQVVCAQRHGRNVTYELTGSGRELGAVFEAMRIWGMARQAEDKHGEPGIASVR